MFTHFTLVSYSPEVELGTEGSFKYDNNLKIYSKYDQGSFKENRKHLYHCIHDREFKITLSGHSHRAALYEPNFDAGWLRDTLNTVGHEIEHTHDMNIPFYGWTPIVVSGCGGPIGVQNLYDAPKANAWKSQDHLKGYGLDWPSGTRIKLDGGVKLKRILPQKDKVPSAQPRFAVAMDFFDLLEERVFLKFESEVEDGPFKVVINENLPDVNFIEEMVLFSFDSGARKWIPFVLTVTGVSPRILNVSMSRPVKKQFEQRVLRQLSVNQNHPLFLSVKFNAVLAETTGCKQYDFSSPWLIRVSIKKNKPRFLELAGFSIERHGKHGEVPDFKWYKKNFKKLYPYNRKLPTSETSDE